MPHAGQSITRKVKIKMEEHVCVVCGRPFSPDTLDDNVCSVCEVDLDELTNGKGDDDE